MPEQLAFTALLNRIFAGPVDALLRAVHIEPAYPRAPITNYLAMEIFVVCFLILLFVLVRLRLSVEHPGGLQHIFEGYHGFIQEQSREIIGHHSEAFTPFLMVLGFYILFCNLLGLVPGFESPTANPTVPLGCAIVVFCYYHAHGIHRKGAWNYAKHFAGPMPALAFLMVPIETISHIARMLSLTVRLYANMFAGDMVTLIFFSLIPVGVPVVFMGLHMGVSIVQAYVFVLLAMVYLGGAVAAEH